MRSVVRQARSLQFKNEASLPTRTTGTILSEAVERVFWSSLRNTVLDQETFWGISIGFVKWRLMIPVILCWTRPLYLGQLLL